MNKLIKRRSNLKSKLKNREKVFAGWTSIAHPSITEIFTNISIDFIGIDIEHSTINQQESQRIVAASQAGGKLCLPRVASHNGEMIKRLLDSGADGVIVPMVNTVDEVRRIISWCKYPPKGARSYGISRAQGYGFDFEEYVNNWNESSSIIIQVESIKGVDNIDSLLEEDDIDGAMIGPYDLSGSLNIPGQIEHQKVREASERIVSSCKQYGKSCGIQLVYPTIENVKEAFSSGYTFVVLASDVFLLWKWSDQMNQLIAKNKQ
ncbi:MAG: aldolase/citrate lyase family protein [bacterium]